MTLIGMQNATTKLIYTSQTAGNYAIPICIQSVLRPSDTRSGQGVKRLYPPRDYNTLRGGGEVCQGGVCCRGGAVQAVRRRQANL